MAIMNYPQKHAHLFFINNKNERIKKVKTFVWEIG